MLQALADRWRARVLALLGQGARGHEGGEARGHENAATGAVGAAAESEALTHLQAAGLKLLARNFLARGGELDLVMADDDCVVFVEVRFRAQGSHGDGLDSVSTSKQKKLIAAARQFLADHPRYARRPTRFDVVALGAGGLRWVRNAFVLDGSGW
ncbi:MAG: YraN family protein [Lysobacterales bacterium]